MRKLLPLLLAVAFCAFAGEIILDATKADAWSNRVKPAEGDVLTTPSATHTVSVASFDVDPAKPVKLSGEFRFVGKMEKGPVNFCFGFRPLTAEGRVISPSTINYISRAFALTETTAAAAKGDTKIVLKDTSTWKKLNKYARLAFDAKPDFSDMPNFKLSNFITKVTPQEDGTSLVDFAKPLDFDVPAGTTVRVQCDSSTYIYTASTGNNKVTEEWKSYSGIIKGMQPGAVPKAWWMGTAKANIVFFTHGPGHSGKLEFRNVKVETVD